MGLDLVARDGRTLDATGSRAERHRLCRHEAIASYTRDAAWFTGEHAHRGWLLPDYDADLCVPSLDPFGCSDDELRDTLSDLTVMDGRITHDLGVLA